MIVCVCHSVSYTDLQKYDSYQEFVKCTHAGTQCGKCRNKLERLSKKAGIAQSVERDFAKVEAVGS